MSTRVLVTGGLGHLGRFVVDDLHAHGYEVVIVDRVRASETLADGLRSVTADVTDVGQLAQVMRGCDAVVHLAAIPSPYGTPDSVVFTNNTQATFAVLQAASINGIGTVALASSGSAYGTAWSPKPTHVRYVPVDEDHPLLNHDAYGLSKEVDERTAEMFCRREAMSVAALRFHWVARREDQLDRVHQRRSHQPSGPEQLRELWGYVDIRDAARACRLAVEVGRAEPFGFLPINVVAADILAEEPIEALLAQFGPDIELRAPLRGTEGAFSIRRAAQVLGWVPRYSWRSPL